MLEEWDRTTPSYRLFSKGIIKECPNCETFVIIASSKEVSTELTNTIKKIVKKVDKNLTHQGVIMHRNQLLLQANELTALNCKLPSVEEINVFYYADRELRECVKLPYDSEDFLRVALENVYGYFDNNEKVFKKLNEVNNEERIRVYKADAKKFIGENYDYLRDLVAVLIVEKITGSKK
jgi:phage FluMu protein Com